MCCFLITFPTVPSAAPTSVSASSTSNSITVQWGAVDCIHRNGDITGYSVRYGVQGSGEGDRTVEIASGDSSGGMYQISGLSSATVYTIEVAAVNNAGTGVYSDPINTSMLMYFIPKIFTIHVFQIHCSVLSTAVQSYRVTIFCESIPHTTTTCSFDGRPAHQCKNHHYKYCTTRFIVITNEQ